LKRLDVEKVPSGRYSLIVVMQTADFGPLPEADVQRLKHIFRNVVSTTGQSTMEASGT
jgi:hypothetical protein